MLYFGFVIIVIMEMYLPNTIIEALLMSSKIVIINHKVSASQ